MYSLVFAADMYATVFKKDPLDPALGEKYKNSILVPGGSREELDSLTVRRGRHPTMEFITRSELTVQIGDVGIPWSPTERGGFHEGVVR
jgi:Zn-dependent oligopeptidase